MATTSEGREVDFKKIPLAEAFQILKCTGAGLTTAEARQRREQYGPNQIPETSRNPFIVFLGYMWNPLSWAMEIAAILAIALLDYVDFALIVVLLVLNATISFVEESNADKAIKALTSALAPKAKVKRDGTVTTMAAAELVPGDVIFLQFGNIVPADVKLLGPEGEDDQPLQVDQAALTGESLPVRKFTGDVAFSGSTIKQGEKECLVYATGLNTFFGRAAALIAGTTSVANLQKVMTKIGAYCLVTIAIWVLVELAVQFGGYEHPCRPGAERCPTLSNLLVLIVGGIPIAMPTVLSVTLALGAFKLAKEGAIVARMSAVEEMAAMDILCSDKTGTLTLNKLSIEKASVLVMPGFSLDEVLKLAALSANIVSEEPIDVVLHEAYDAHETLWDNHTSTKYVPFNPVDKYTVNHVKPNDGSRPFRVLKGAPQVVLKHAHNRDEINTVVSSRIVEFAGRGFRALGLAIAPDDGTPVGQAKWEFVALLPLFDPPRHDTAATIAECVRMGIRVKMVTGDQLLIGKETARQLGMGSVLYTTETLIHAMEGTEALPAGANSVQELVEAADGFAEVFPEHKFEIVKILQARNHMVGMTGDGVNDAPALRKANVGIAVSGATDAARGAADIVLTQPGLSVIITAVLGARKIFQRMVTYSKYTIAMTFRICFTFGLLSVIYDWYFPTILIVLLAVFNDGAMIALSKDRVTPSPVPNAWHLPSVFGAGVVYGLYLTVSTWTLYFVASHLDFFEHKLGLPSLNTTADHLQERCISLVEKLRFRPAAQACTIYPGQRGCDSITVEEQCVAEQKYVRNSILRSLLYCQVSISGQALVFVVRTMSHSLANRAGFLTYVAFFVAQVLSTLLAGLGFGGYHHPWGIVGGKFTQLSNGQMPLFLANSGNRVPLAHTEAEFVPSVIGCGAYVIVAWVWSVIWYVALDPIKWGVAWILNEDGIRNRIDHKKLQDMLRYEATSMKRAEQDHEQLPSVTRSGWMNPLGRGVLPTPTAAHLERASMVRILPVPKK